MFPVTAFVPPFESFCVWGGGFTPEECDQIKQTGELLEFERGRVGNDLVDGDVRNSTVTWIAPSRDTEWIFGRIDSIVGRVNFDKFQLALDAFDGLQYTKYGVEQHYDWHIDAIERPQNPALHRKLSVAIMLSDPSEYEGGELILNAGGNPDNAVSLKQSKGDVIFFYSFVPHKVAPVTSGERVSLVTWMLGAKLC